MSSTSNTVTTYPPLQLPLYTQHTLASDPRLDPRLKATLQQCGIIQAAVGAPPPPPAPARKEFDVDEIVARKAEATVIPATDAAGKDQSDDTLTTTATPQPPTTTTATATTPAPAPPPITEDSPLETLHQVFTAIEAATPVQMAPIMPPPRDDAKVIRRAINDVFCVLVEAKARDPDKDIPVIVNLHGGGMATGTIEWESVQNRYMHEAVLGNVAVLGVEFANSTGRLGRHPFPKALDQITSVVEWLYHHKRDYGYGKTIVYGVSGGGNLALAAALSLKRQGKAHMVDGVFASCPFIGGPDAYTTKKTPQHFSVVECDGYWLHRASLVMYCRLYDPEGKNSGNPLAWPACATEDDVRGLMPHFILVQELDPLRDEGVAYYRTLARAGVQAQCMMEMGVTHSAYGLSTHMPDFFRRSIALLSGFAYSL